MPGSNVRKVDRRIIFPGGGEVQVRSADNPDSLRGEGLDFVVMDECAFMQEAAWSESLRPALSDRQGRAMFISTPKGRNWFWRHWTRGQDAHADEWAAWQFPTSDNPYIADEEIEAARRSLPERIFQQEYLAMFLDDAGGVFRRVMEAATAELQDPQEGGQYVIGADWGRSNDFTVFVVLDVQKRRMVHMDRFTQIDYDIQTGRLRSLVKRYNPSVIIAEYNAMGGPIVERLQAEGLPVQGFQTTNKTKEVIIRGLESAFENQEIAILNDPVLIGELQAYEQERLSTGWRFTAPAGMHDDTVIALALAWHSIAATMPAFL